MFWLAGKQSGYRVKSGSPRHEARCPSAANTAELRKRIGLSKSGQTLVAVEIVEMRCLVHVFGGTLLGLRV
jgi:hypothetical protein